MPSPTEQRSPETVAQARQLRDNPLLWALIEQLRKDKTSALLGAQDREKREAHWQFLNSLQAVTYHVKSTIDSITGDDNGTD